METMSALRQDLPTLKIQLAVDDFQNLGVTPWFSYTVTLPKPLVPLSERPHLKTERLNVRPITSDDLDGFYELRSRSELQLHSKTRGRPDKSKEESSQHLNAFQYEYESHWYFGAFLQSTGELIGEGGMPDCQHMVTSASGWPEAEFFIKPEYWRQGYGTEFFNAVMDSWWGLPREKKRHQLIPAVAPGLEPGDELPEGAVFQWEDGNDAARCFFAKVLAQAPVGAEGGFESIDTREGREGNLVRWTGTLTINPNWPLELKDEE